MPRAIISPSVLASDFGQLTAECKRMITNGAEWLHMGQNLPVHYHQIAHPHLDIMDGSLSYSQKVFNPHLIVFVAILFRILQWVNTLPRQFSD